MDISGGDRESLRKEKNIMATKRVVCAPVTVEVAPKLYQVLATGPYKGFRVDETDLNGNSVRFVGAYETREEADKMLPRNDNGASYGSLRPCRLIKVDSVVYVLAPDTVRVLS